MILILIIGTPSIYITSSKAYLKWSQMICTTNLLIEYALVDGNINLKQTPLFNGSLTEYTVTGLRQLIHYKFRLKGIHILDPPGFSGFLASPYISARTATFPGKINSKNPLYSNPLK